MADTVDSRGELLPHHAFDSLEALQVLSGALQLADPLLGRFAKMCVDLARERRLEIEARLAARLRELSKVFATLDELRAKEVNDRDLQFRALSTLLDFAKTSGDPILINEAMRCFRTYVQSAPTLTRDFSDALHNVNLFIEPVPGTGSEE